MFPVVTPGYLLPLVASSEFGCCNEKPPATFQLASQLIGANVCLYGAWPFILATG